MFVGGAAVGAGGGLDGGDGLGVPLVAFVFGAPVVFAGVGELRKCKGGAGGVGEAVAAEGLAGQDVEADALDAAGGAGEAAVHDLGVQARRLRRFARPL